MKSLEAFIQGYIDCALWTSVDDNGIPLDEDCDASDLSSETRTSMTDDCTTFWNAYNTLLDDASQAGHDFWFTRNHHGAGFWDGDYPEQIGEILTDASHGYGSFDLYVDDNGLVSHC